MHTFLKRFLQSNLPQQYDKMRFKWSEICRKNIRLSRNGFEEVDKYLSSSVAFLWHVVYLCRTSTCTMLLVRSVMGVYIQDLRVFELTNLQQVTGHERSKMKCAVMWKIEIKEFLTYLWFISSLLLFVSKFTKKYEFCSEVRSGHACR